MQETHASSWDCFKQILAKEGRGGLFKGSAPSIYKAAVSTSLSFTVYEQTIQLLDAQFGYG